jgi:hypothetical protein
MSWALAFTDAAGPTLSKLRRGMGTTSPSISWCGHAAFSPWRSA